MIVLFHVIAILEYKNKWIYVDIRLQQLSDFDLVMTIAVFNDSIVACDSVEWNGNMHTVKWGYVDKAWKCDYSVIAS